MIRNGPSPHAQLNLCPFSTAYLTVFLTIILQLNLSSIFNPRDRKPSRCWITITTSAMWLPLPDVPLDGISDNLPMSYLSPSNVGRDNLALGSLGMAFDRSTIRSKSNCLQVFSNDYELISSISRAVAFRPSFLRPAIHGHAICLSV